jgi:dynein heavy chain
LATAEAELQKAEDELRVVQEYLDKLNAELKAANDKATAMKDEANKTEKRMKQANGLINALSGEKNRWTYDANSFADNKRKLIGDVSIACAFVS